MAALPHHPGASRERGYLLLVLFLFAALISIGLMRTIPAAFVATQREREEELIFRGQQYQHAIQSFVRKFGRYPNSLGELEQTNRIRFLRRRYQDPMKMKKRDPVETEDVAASQDPTKQETLEGWRLIHVGPGGTFPDAKNPPALPTLGAATSTPSAPGSLGSLPLSPEMQRPSGTPPAPTGSTAPGSTSVPSPFQPAAPQTGGFGAPTQIRQNPFATPGTGAGTVAPGVTPPGLFPSANPAANPAQQPRAAAAAQQQAPLVFGGGGIAGVASKNTAESIKVWNGYSTYEEWEFIYDFRTDPIGAAAIARLSGIVAQPTPQPVAPGQPPTPTTQPTPQPGFPPTPVPSPFGQPPGIRPGTPSFPPSPIPGMPPLPRPR